MPTMVTAERRYIDAAVSLGRFSEFGRMSVGYLDTAVRRRFLGLLRATQLKALETAFRRLSTCWAIRLLPCLQDLVPCCCWGRQSRAWCSACCAQTDMGRE